MNAFVFQRRIGWIALAALPLAIQVGAEARRAPAAQPAPAQPASSDYFESRVRPVLAANCYDCHADERMGGLRLDAREAMLKGGRSGPALVPGDPDESLIIKAVRQSSEKLKMPKGGRLRPEEIEALTAWVRAGAPWFNASAAAATAGGAAATAPVAAAASAARSDA